MKGTGSLPEDTTIYGYISVSEDSRYVTLENLCIDTTTEHNSLSVPVGVDGYLTLRNCFIKGTGTDTAAFVVIGKISYELYSYKIVYCTNYMYFNINFNMDLKYIVITYISI